MDLGSRVYQRDDPTARHLDAAYAAQAARLANTRQTIHRLTQGRMGSGQAGTIGAPPSVRSAGFARVGLARPVPMPGPLPPIFVPGTSDNTRFAREFADTVERLRGSFGRGAGYVPKPQPSFEDECDELNLRDLANCKLVKATGGNAAECYDSANRRDWECRKFGPSGIRTRLATGW